MSWKAFYGVKQKRISSSVSIMRKINFFVGKLVDLVLKGSSAVESNFIAKLELVLSLNFLNVMCIELQ